MPEIIIAFIIQLLIKVMYSQILLQQINLAGNPLSELNITSPNINPNNKGNAQPWLPTCIL